MDDRAAKLALARQKLKDHQNKKSVPVLKDDNSEIQEVATTSPYEQTVTPIPASKGDLNYNSECNVQNELPQTESTQCSNQEVNVTEILISNKRNLETQVSALQSNLSQLQFHYADALKQLDVSKQQISHLQSQFQDLNDKYLLICNELKAKEEAIDDLYITKTKLSEENNNLIDQLDFTKSILSAKETENSQLYNQLHNLRKELDVTQLKFEQLINGTTHEPPESDYTNTENNESLQHRIIELEEKINLLNKEREQMKSHYEHYVEELNEQLKSLATKNNDLQSEVIKFSDRERDLIEQISYAEIRMQNFMQNKNLETEPAQNNELKELNEKYIIVQEQLRNLSLKYEELQKCYTDSEAMVMKLSQEKELVCDHNDISIEKLNADITSDKIAAQRATEQNKKLKTDVEELQQAFIKMSNDKLELTEKLAAEKYLNRELTIKLAEIEEKAKGMHVKLMAKDEEMIRLQVHSRELETRLNQLSEDIKSIELEDRVASSDQHQCSDKVHQNAIECQSKINQNNHSCHLTMPDTDMNLPKEDAMSKLQQRFLKIMDEVADLSDEKHRLEHIILQLQNETDTICEYIALYQQQRSLLKKRDEERTAQINLFQTECEKLKMELDELNQILTRFIEDTELSSYLQVESRQKDVAKVMKLLLNLKNNSLVDPIKNIKGLKNFYPCNCCSGNLIDI